MRSTKKRLDAWLSPTPCTQEMREQLISIADKQGRSVADLQRSAIALFLSGFDKESTVKDKETNKQELA